MSADTLCAAFGVGQSSASNKAKLIRDMFGIYPLDPRWCLPGRMEENPFVWMLEVDGFVVDVRYLPRKLQEAALKKGLIPYIPEDFKEVEALEVRDSAQRKVDKLVEKVDPNQLKLF
jgi:hypothetical protein